MPEPLYRKSFDAAALLREHPPQFQHPHKEALFEIAYPDESGAAGTIEVTRWPQQVPPSIALSSTLDAEVRPDFYDYISAGDASAVEWHVNFADPRLFAVYGSGLFAQDEMQVAEHPLLGSVREALLAEDLAAKTSDETGATPILVRNVQRRIEIATNPDAAAGRPDGLYGNQFAAASLDAVRKRATRRIDPPTYSNIIAIAAPSGGRGDYNEKEIEFIFQTAYTAFAAAQQESSADKNAATRTIIHTGFWGCGAFAGNRELMIALQALAARAANVARLVIHACDPAGVDDATRGLDVAESLAHRCGATCTLDTIVGRAVILGYRWGTSDGN